MPVFIHVCSQEARLGGKEEVEGEVASFSMELCLRVRASFAALVIVLTSL